jgi:hypothetical protein
MEHSRRREQIEKRPGAGGGPDAESARRGDRALQKLESRRNTNRGFLMLRQWINRHGLFQPFLAL